MISNWFAIKGTQEQSDSLTTKIADLIGFTEN